MRKRFAELSVNLTIPNFQLSDYELKHEGQHRHPGGHNTLNCFAASTIKTSAATKNYVFYWQRDGRNISLISGRTEHEEHMWEPPGMALKLGLIQVSPSFRKRVLLSI